ncbi:MAG: L,D-transpeptidase family protein [Parerythrobacter sp.]
MRRFVGGAAILALSACAPVTPEPAPTEAPVAVQTPFTGTADFVLVDKSDRTLALYSGGRLVRIIGGIAFGDAPYGHKRFKGDERTPEGRYNIDTRNPNSAYHLSLRISYPNAADRAFAERLGRDPGGDIFIHGQPNMLPAADTGARLPGDWTDGCIAVGNAEMEELWRAIPDETPIVIQP